MAHKIGDKFNRLTLIEPMGKFGSGRWVCQCDCGQYVTRGVLAVKKGAAKSCGCLKAEKLKVTKTIHGGRYTREYASWRNARRRCDQVGGPKWERYGGRGIKVCDRWSSFQNFREDMGDCPLGMTLDRINNDGHYEPGNCRWATRKTQAVNRSGRVFVKMYGSEVLITEAEKHLGLRQGVIANRSRHSNETRQQSVDHFCKRKNTMIINNARQSVVDLLAGIA